MADFEINNIGYNSEKYISFLKEVDPRLNSSPPTRNFEFLPTTVGDEYLEGKYAIKMYGILPNGDKKTVFITGIQPFVEIEFVGSGDRRQTILEIDSIVSYAKKEIIEGKYLIGIHDTSEWYRYSFDTLHERRKFLKGIETYFASGVIRKSNDKPNEYYMIVSRIHDFSLSAWNVISVPNMFYGNTYEVSVDNIKKAESPSEEASNYCNTTLAWDIETYYIDFNNRSDGVPLPKDKNAQMSCISMVIKMGNKFTKFITASIYNSVKYSPEKSPLKKNREELFTDITVNDHIYCADEKELILVFFDIIKYSNPDFMIAFNDFRYDWLWIIHRLNTYELNKEAYDALSSKTHDDMRTGLLSSSIDDKNSKTFLYMDVSKDEEESKNISHDYTKKENYTFEDEDEDNIEEYDEEYEEEVSEEEEGSEEKVKQKQGFKPPTPIGRMIKTEAGQNTDAIFPNGFHRVLFLDSHIILKKGDPKGESSLNYFLEANKLGKKNDIDHIVAQHITSVLVNSLNDAPTSGVRKYVYDNIRETCRTYKKQLDVIGLKDCENVSQILAAMLNYCLVDSVKTSLLMERSEEILSKRMLADLSHVSLYSAFYDGISKQVSNILSKYCDKFGLKYSTDKPLKSQGEGKYPGALVIPPKILGSITTLNIKQKYEQQSVLIDHQLPVTHKKKKSEGSIDIVGYVSGYVKTDFDKPYSLKELLRRPLRKLGIDDHETFFVYAKFAIDTILTSEYKFNNLTNFSIACAKYLKSDEYKKKLKKDKKKGITEDDYVIPDFPKFGKYRWINELFENIYIREEDDDDTDPTDSYIKAFKNLYKCFVYIDTTLHDYYEIKDNVFILKFHRANIDFKAINRYVRGVIKEYAHAQNILRDHIYTIYEKAGLSDSQRKYLLEYSNLAVTALDFSSLYPSIVEEFNISIDKMIVSTGDPDLYEKYVNDPKYKTIVCYFGDPTVPRTAHCLKHYGDVSEYGVYAYLLRDLKVVRENIRKNLGSAQGIQKQILHNKQLAVKLIMNSVYGIMGNPLSQARCIEMSAGITSEGVKHLKFARDIVEETGALVRYGDTDSLYFSRPLTLFKDTLLSFMREEMSVEEFNILDVQEATSFAAETQKTVNTAIKKKNDDVGVIKMSYEEALKPFFTLNKKKYFGLGHTDPNKVSFDVYDESFLSVRDRLFIRGMEFKRRSSTKILIDIAQDILRHILDIHNYKTGDVVQFIREKLLNISDTANKNREELLGLFAKSVPIKENKNNYTIASIKNKLPNYELISGSQVKTVCVVMNKPPYDATGLKKAHNVSDKTYPLDYVLENPEFSLDLEHYLNNSISTNLSDIISYMYIDYLDDYMYIQNESLSESHSRGTKNNTELINVFDVDKRNAQLKKLAEYGFAQFISDTLDSDITNIDKEEAMNRYGKYAKLLFRELTKYLCIDKIYIIPEDDINNKTSINKTNKTSINISLHLLIAAYSPSGSKLEVYEEDSKGKPVKKSKYAKNYKMRARIKNASGVAEVNANNRIWLANLFINVYIDNGGDIKNLDIKTVRTQFDKNKDIDRFIDDLDNMKKYYLEILKIILERRADYKEVAGISDAKLEPYVHEQIPDIHEAIYEYIDQNSDDTVLEVAKCFQSLVEFLE